MGIPAIVASQNGLLCAAILARETEKAWYVQYKGEKVKETRISKDSGRCLFENVDLALEWLDMDFNEKSQ